MSTADPTAPNPSDPTLQRPPGAHRTSDVGPPAGSDEPRLAMKRTGWDVVLGVVFVLMGAFVLGNVVIASVVSVLFLGWTLLIGGVVAVVLALLRIGQGGFWIGLVGGALSLVAGLVFVRNPGATLLALSLAVGGLLVAGGIIRIVLAVQEPEQRVPLVLSGVLSAVLGLMILNRWPESALWLLGTLVGVQLLVDGVLLMLLGRLRVTT